MSTTGENVAIEFTEGVVNADVVVGRVSSPEFGAVVTFIGTVRSANAGENVDGLFYDAYRPLADRQAQRIVADAEERWPVRCAIVHRLGHVDVGECSVAIAAASPHRADAFEACRWLLDQLKQTVPIWKKEKTPTGAYWVEGSDRVRSQSIGGDGSGS